MKGTLDALVKGFRIGNFEIYAGRITRGRFIEEKNFVLCLRKGVAEDYLLTIKFFSGRRPYYKSWAELFSINNRINLEGEALDYVDSAFEENILRLSSSLIEPGGAIFVEYHEDAETASGLMSGYPMPVTRLGYKLFRLDFTWFKDWYFPEGLMEGGRKLQGEKPLNNEIRMSQLRKMRDEINTFLRHLESSKENTRYEENAANRAREVLQMIKIKP